MTKNSTIVRIIRSVAPGLSWISPALAARCLEGLFLTTRRYPRPKREQLWLQSAKTLTLKHNNKDLPISIWTPNDQTFTHTVVLVHGWSGRGSQLGAFAEPLVKQGARVIAFDAPGHGDAPGRISGLPWIAQAFSQVADSFGPIDAVIAHSLGTAATSLAIAQGTKVKRAVYLAPPVSPHQYLNRAATMLGFSPDVEDRARARIEARFQFQMADADAAVLASKVTLPLLIIHDQDDKDVPISEGRSLAALFKQAQLIETHGFGHNRLLRQDAVVDKVTQFALSGCARACSSQA